MKRILLAVLALVCAASASAAPFQNGSFDLGGTANCNAQLNAGDSSITGWTVSVGNIELVDGCAWLAPQGSRSLDLVGNGSVGGIAQTFDTVVGQTYVVSFDLAGNPSATFPPAIKNLTVTVSSDGVARPYTFDTTGRVADAYVMHMGWTKKFFTFVATATSTTIDFVSDMTGSTFAGALLDNVNIAPLGGPNDVWTGGMGQVFGGIAASGGPITCAGPLSNWTQTGGPWIYPLTVTSDGVNGPVVASYDVPSGNSGDGICGTFVTSATATASGAVTVQWDYRGGHSSFSVTAELQGFVYRGGMLTGVLVQSDAVVTNLSAGGGFLHSGQYVFNVQAGDSYGFKITGSNYDFADAIFGTLSLTHTFLPAATTLATPVLIRALPVGSAIVPLVIGRLDGSPNTPITVRLYSGTTCSNGVLGGGIAQIGADASVTTDPDGYFGTLQGDTQGKFVAVGVVSPQVTPLSACAVSAADNDTWPKALSLAGATVTVPDWIDAAGKARWYKFSVLPGQSVQVSLSALPADYDLAVFKDIGQAFDGALVPANTQQLTKLSAQYAPSAFSPSAFSPSAFSPSAFSPSAFSPSAFSPSAFSPSAFSPSAFSPSAFSPSAFSPSAFSPSAFSPSAFSPSAFSPSAFSPSAFSPSAFSGDELAQAFSSAQTQSIIATSMTPGTGNESVTVNTWNNTGEFYVRVTGRAGAFSTTPYNLVVAKQGTSCAAVTDTVISSRTPLGSGYKTVILYDSARTPLSATVPGGTLGGKLTAFAQRPEVSGTLVDVAIDPRVMALKAQAGLAINVPCPYAKNLVAAEIKSIVDAYLAGNSLQYIVIVGNDDAIPFFRYPDQSLLGQESGYVPPVSSSSASEASLRRDFVLGQDAYGAATHISLGSGNFPIPGVAVGRLIETPTEIAGMIDAYVETNGTISPTSSLVTGYDFLQDAADAVRAELFAGIGLAPDTLITANNVSPEDTRSYANGGPWTASDLRQKLLSTRHDVMFLGGHFNAVSALAADFKTSVATSDLGASNNFTNALIFSAGCHAGYNVIDTDAIPGVTFTLDWAQAFAQKKATLIAGTGYQYGDTDFLEYSERLYLNFAKELRAGTGKVAIGEALVKAKVAYLAATQGIRGIHEKALLEATLFGLPMLAVNMPQGRTPVTSNVGVITPTLVPPSRAATLGLHIANPAPIAAPLSLHTLTLTNFDDGSTTLAKWLSGPNGVVTNPVEPAIPLTIVNVTPTDPSLVLRGVGFRGGAYSESLVVPLTGAPTTELRGVHTPFSSPVFYPMRLWTTNYFGALAGAGGTNLLVTPAQHRAKNATESTLRQYSDLRVRLYYSSLTSTSNSLYAGAALSDAPTIVSVDAVPGTGVVAFSARVVGDPDAAMHEVWVTYTDGAGGNGTWTSFNLSQCTTPLAVCGTTVDSQYWKGEIPASGLPADMKYVVQAVNGTGLVSLDDNLGRYYSVVSATPAATTALALGASAPGSAFFGDSPSITMVLTAGGSPLAGKLVTIAVGSSAANGTTDASGAVTVKLPVVSTPGTYSLTASFAGEGALLPSLVSVPFTIAKAPTTLSLLTSGTGAVLTAKVAGKTQPLMQQSIRFSVTGPGGAKDVYAITDYLGRATLPPVGLPAGAYTVSQANFDATPTYAAAASLNMTGARFVLPAFAFGGFLQPVDNPPTLNNMKAGQAVPVKFSLGGNRGLAIFDAGYPATQSTTCGFTAGSDIEETSAAGGSSLQYDGAKDQYTYVWKTEKAWAGTCRVLLINFVDGTQRRANFQFR